MLRVRTPKAASLLATLLITIATDQNAFYSTTSENDSINEQCMLFIILNKTNFR